MFWLIALLAAGEPPSAPDPVVTRMVALYDEVCLKAFPDDAAVEALMAAKGAEPLTPEDVRVTLRDDPGRGWRLADGDRNIQVMLELPPYHTCSVRRSTASGFGDLTAYRAAAETFKSTRRGFAPIDEQSADIDAYHVHMSGELRDLADGGAETLYLFDQVYRDPARQAASGALVDIRFVHQIVSPDAQ